MSLASSPTPFPTWQPCPPRRGDSGAAMRHRDSAGQRQWFEERLEPLMDRLYGTALRLTRHPDDAEDIVAEAVGQAWRRLDTLRDPRRFEAWLFHILTNTFISEWRRRRSHPQDTPEGHDTDHLEATEFTLFQQLHQPFLLWWGSLEEQFFNSVLEEELQAALDALPDPFRLVIVLVEVQGYRYEEVSRLLGIPLGTVRSRLNRARGLLQKALWQQARDAGITSGHQGEGGP